MPVLCALALLAAPAPLPPGAPSWLADPFPGQWETPPEPRPAGKREVLIDVVAVEIASPAAPSPITGWRLISVEEARKACRSVAVRDGILTRCVLEESEGNEAKIEMTSPDTDNSAGQRPGWTLSVTGAATPRGVQLKIDAHVFRVIKRGAMPVLFSGVGGIHSPEVPFGQVATISVESGGETGEPTLAHIWLLAPRLGPVSP